MSLITGCGAVLGVDIGWSQRQPTTGLCLIKWSKGEVEFSFSRASADEAERIRKLNELVKGERLLAVGIDGSLIPGLRLTNRYRSAEALLSRGKFRHRGKPAPTSSKLGQLLHQEATRLARLVTRTQDIAPAKHLYKIHHKAVIEAFPNAFLGVLHSDKHFPTSQQVKRRWTDVLFPRLRHKIARLLRAILPHHHFKLNRVQGHEVIASFVCALSALCLVAGKCVALGDKRLGYIILPPLEFWGDYNKRRGKWAWDALINNRAWARTQFGDAEIYQDNRLWFPNQGR